MLPNPTLWSPAPLRFVVSAVPAGPAGPQQSTAKTWTAIATLGDQTLFQRGENLSDLLTQLRADCFEKWLYLKHPSRRIPMALMLDPIQILESELQCPAHWRPDDIAAECWLEAASQLQVPVAQLLMDFEVQLQLPQSKQASKRKYFLETSPRFATGDTPRNMLNLCG